MSRNENPKEQSRRPPDTALRQQRMKGWKPVLNPVWVIGALYILGVLFLPTGFYLQQKSDKIVELSLEYDSHDKESLPCGIERRANNNKTCILSFTANQDMEPPILVYYQLTNFYQNHRKYVESRDELQLQGQLVSKQTAVARRLCEPMVKLGNISLHPCGLFANTFFNDIIQLVNSTDLKSNKLLDMVEKGIIWQSELDYRYKQPDGFDSEQCVSCEDCSCEGERWSCDIPWTDPKDGKCYRYFYPDDDTTQYLYETYPMVINPIEGVENEHFIVWMKTATLPKFRKLYGFIKEPISKGTNLTFQVTANFEVQSFKGTKTLIVTTTNAFGGKNDYFGLSFLVVGAVNIFFALFFTLKHWLAPRKLGDPIYLKYKNE